MLAVSSNPRFADKVNWDEMVSVAIAVFKGHHRGPEEIERGSPYFAEMLQRFMQGDPRYVARFFELWQQAEGRRPKVRWSYPVVWTEPGLPVMRFEVVVNTASEPAWPSTTGSRSTPRRGRGWRWWQSASRALESGSRRATVDR